MDWTTAFGVACLGIVVGGLVCHFVQSNRRFRIQELRGAISILGGTAVLGFMHFIDGGKATHEYWFYPMGLIIGFIAIWALNLPDEA